MSDIAPDVLTSTEAGGRIIRGSALRVASSLLGILAGAGTAALLLHHLGVAESGRYVTVISLVAIAQTIADSGLNATGSRDLAVCPPAGRRQLIGDLLGLRLVICPIALVLVITFAAVAGYPQRMVAGTALAGAGLFIIAAWDAFLLRLTVELRNGTLALLDALKQVVTLAGVALLVALGASLEPFFAVQIAVAAAVVGTTLVVAGTDIVTRPRFDRGRQRRLLASALPVAIAFILGQLYFRIVILLMSLVASAQQTGYFGGSLRAIESVAIVPVIVAGIALPMLSAAARDDHARLRYAVQSLVNVSIIAGTGLTIVTVRAAGPIMSIIGGASFRPSGDVLRIQVGALLFIGLSQVGGTALIALSRQRDLIITNALALAGVGAFAGVLVPLYGARGGAAATVMGDALLAALVYWRLSRSSGQMALQFTIVAKVALAAIPAVAVLLIRGLPDLVVAALAGLVYLTVGQLIGMLPRELPEALRRDAGPAAPK